MIILFIQQLKMFATSNCCGQEHGTSGENKD